MEGSHLRHQNCATSSRNSGDPDGFFLIDLIGPFETTTKEISMH